MSRTNAHGDTTPHDSALPQVTAPQLNPTPEDAVLVVHEKPKKNLDRFAHTKKLIDLFSQTILNFLCETHEASVTHWISQDAQGRWVVENISENTEGAYPPHIIAFHDFIHFLNVVRDNLDLVNQLLTSSRYGIPGVLYTLSNVRQTCKKTQKFLASFKKLQKSISAIKQLPIHNGIINGALYLYEQISNYFQGKGDSLVTIFQ